MQPSERDLIQEGCEDLQAAWLMGLFSVGTGLYALGLTLQGLLRIARGSLARLRRRA